MGLNLLVLSCGPRCIGENILRSRKIFRRFKQICVNGQDHSYGSFAFPERHICTTKKAGFQTRNFGFFTHGRKNSWLPTVGKLVFAAKHDSGGHFAAHEKSVELVNDLRGMFGRKGPAHGIVNGKDGY